MDERTRYPITCAPVFDMVMRDASLCRSFVERVLGIEIGSISYHAIEHVTSPALDARGVRLDAFLKGTGVVYNIEMQAYRQAALGKRLRYHQAALDTEASEKGSEFRGLPESYIVFVCDYDPFKLGLPVYDIERTCAQAPGLVVGDASHWRVLNARAWAAEPDPGLGKLLEYIATGNPDDALTERLDAMVDDINADPERRARMNGFMTLEHSMAALAAERYEEGEAVGMEKGQAQAQARYGALVDRLLDDNRLDDLKQSAADPQRLEALFKEYGL